MLRQLALAAIGIYKRHVSPRKGYACAHRIHHGGASCSTLGLRAIRRHGVVKGLALLRARMQRCAGVPRPTANRASGAPRGRAAFAQRGDCDLGCDADCAGPRGAGRALEWLSCCDAGSCDGPRRQPPPPRERRRAR